MEENGAGELLVTSMDRDGTQVGYDIDLMSKISLKYTFSLDEFGNSIPTVLLPGIVEIRADSELVFLAMSSDRLIIFDTLTPAAGSNSFNVRWRN